MDAPSLRQALATLAYRAAKVIRDAPPGFEAFTPAPGSRTAGHILAHMGDLFDWAIALADGQHVWRNSSPRPWAEEATRFFGTLQRFDERLASAAPLQCPPERLFQGPIADALTHTGQLAMLRRLAGAPVRGENYYKAEVVVGRVDADQPPPRVEFD